MFNPPHEESNTTNEDETFDDGLFDGDSGTLEPEVRRALTALILRPTITDKNSDGTRTYRVITANEEVLRSRLHDMFLELHVHRDQRMAYVSQIKIEESSGRHLTRTSTLNIIETAVLLNLKNYRHDEIERGVDPDSVISTVDELVDSIFERHVALQNKENLRSDIKKALARFITWDVARWMVTDETFQITDAIDVIMSIEKMRSLNARISKTIDDTVDDENETDETNDLFTSEGTDFS